MGVSSRLLCALSVLLLGAAGGLGQPASTQPLIDGLSIGGMSGLAMLLQQAGLPVPEALSQAEQLFGTLGSMKGTVQDMFCTKPTVTRGGKVPSILYGPQLNITISPGNCSLAKDASLGGKNITCFGPSVSYSKAPISFVPKHHASDVFVDGSCVLSKPVGPQKGVQVEELYRAEDDLVFASLDCFLEALNSGGLGSIWGSGGGGSGTGGTAAASAVPPLLHRSGSDAAATAAAAPAAAGTEAKPDSLQALLQRAGWQVLMQRADTDAAGAGAPMPAP